MVENKRCSSVASLASQTYLSASVMRSSTSAHLGILGLRGEQDHTTSNLNDQPPGGFTPNSSSLQLLSRNGPVLLLPPPLYWPNNTVSSLLLALA